MAAFSAAIQAQLERKMVRVAQLVEFHFLDAVKRVWTGFGDTTIGGHVWQGTNELGSITGISQARDGSAEQATFSLSGVAADLLAKAVGDPEQYTQRPVKVFLQFFDDDWQPLDSPQAIWLGYMDTLQITRTGDDGPTRTITMTAENVFANRARPPYGSYSDSDQQARYSGDKGCERVAALVNAVREWPKS